MSDCGKVEMRERLVELLHGRLDAHGREDVEAHVRECADCAAELELMRAVRAAAATPVVDVGRIVRALPRPADVGPAPRRVVSRAWRVAAAALLVAGGGVLLSRPPDAGRLASGEGAGRAGGAEARRGAAVSPPPAAIAAPSRAPSAPAAASSGLAFGGDISELGDEELESLLVALDDLELLPVEEPADAALLVEPDTSGGVR